MKHLRLKKGQKVPEFKVKGLQGVDINLNTQEKNLLLLSFFRYASCPL